MVACFRRSRWSFSIMKRGRGRYWLGIAAAVASTFGLALIWAGARRPARYRGDWFQVSTPVVGNRTNAGANPTTVTFCVSNLGPRAVDFKVWWFECRAKTDRSLLATNQFAGRSIPLFPRGFTNLTVRLLADATPAEDCLCACKVSWFERRAAWRELRDRVSNWGLSLLDISWPLWQPEEVLRSGETFAANEDVADYFRWMHGLTREQLLENRARLLSSRAGGSAERRYGRMPTADELLEFEAYNAFSDFCLRAIASNRASEPVACPPPAPPQR